MEQGESSETLAQVILGNAYFSKEFIHFLCQNAPEAFEKFPSIRDNISIVLRALYYLSTDMRSKFDREKSG